MPLFRLISTFLYSKSALKTTKFLAYGFFLLSTILSINCFAILGGQKVEDKQIEDKIIKFDIQLEDQSIVCSGVAIGANRVLTAAHCFTHLIDKKCLLNNSFDSSNETCKTKVKSNVSFGDYKIIIHPNYESINKSEKYLSTINYDLALIVFSKKKFDEFYEMPLEKGRQPSTAYKNYLNKIEFFGYGMSELKREKKSGNTYFIENKRGDLRRSIAKDFSKKNGLYFIKNSMLSYSNRQNKYINFENGQVLRSDSGGPVLAEGKLVGIIRNYVLKEKTTEFFEKERLNSLSTTQVVLESIFTDLTVPGVRQFIKKNGW